MRKYDLPIENYFEQKNKETSKKQGEIIMYFELLEDFFDLSEKNPEKEIIQNILKSVCNEKGKRIDLKESENSLLQMENKEFFNAVIRGYIIKINYLYRMLGEIQKAIKQGKDKRQVEGVRSEMVTFLKGDFEKEYDNIIPQTERFLGYKEYIKITDWLSKNYIKHDRLAYNEEELTKSINTLREIKDRLVIFKEDAESDPFTDSIKGIFRQVRAYLYTDKNNIASYDTQGYQEDIEIKKRHIAKTLLDKFSKN